MATEQLTLRQLMSQVEEQVKSSTVVADELQTQILERAAHPDEEFARDFLELFRKYISILHACSQNTEAYSPAIALQAFLLSAILIEVGLKSGIYNTQAQELMAHYLMMLKGHAYKEYFRDGASDQAGSRNPIWSIILTAFASP
jgi:EAL domain-containing protein (putative c-di-GMP-specific phosphodiesterase class I)